MCLTIAVYLDIVLSSGLLFLCFALKFATLVADFSLSGKLINNLIVDCKKGIIVCNCSSNWYMIQIIIAYGNV